MFALERSLIAIVLFVVTHAKGHFISNVQTSKPMNTEGYSSCPQPHGHVWIVFLSLC